MTEEVLVVAGLNLKTRINLSPSFVLERFGFEEDCSLGNLIQ